MSEPFRLRHTGKWRSLSQADRAALVNRPITPDEEVRAGAAAILAQVRERGDDALLELALRHDRVRLDELEVPSRSVKRALDRIDPALRSALERAATNIAKVHSDFRPVASSTTPEPGITIMRRFDPIARVGVYAPGGRASYPSSVLMAAVPARVAGVSEIVLTSPPDESGAPPDAVLAAAALSGVDRVFSIGGAGAIAAMALGTATVPRVDRVVGPGNAWVAAAKLLVRDMVAIDCPAGPSELVVIADETSEFRVVAGEMVAQAEHDPLAIVIALAVGPDATALTIRELELAAAAARRNEIVTKALRDFGGVLEVESLLDAVRAANEIAPEHLLLSVDGAESLVDEVRNAGSVFVGSASSVAFGDYMTGANHVLPTGGAARSYSGLSPLDFVRWTTFQSLSREAAANLASDVAVFATAEGLPGHAAAAQQWLAS